MAITITKNKIQQPILITGASGFIGSNLLRFFISKGIKVNIILRKKSDIWRIKDIIGKTEVFYTDLREKEKIFVITTLNHKNRTLEHDRKFCQPNRGIIKRRPIRVFTINCLRSRVFLISFTILEGLI